MRVQVSALLTSEFTFAEQAGSLVRHLFETYPDANLHTVWLQRLNGTLYAFAHSPGVPPADLPRFVPSWAFVVPTEQPYETTLDESERTGE